MGPVGFDEAYNSSKNFEPAKVTTFDDEMDAFGLLYARYFDDPDVKCVAVNTNKTVNNKAILTKLMNNGWAWAQVIANKGSRPISQFAEINPEKPLLAIVDKSGTVKYAGSAYGFLPKMILAKVTGTPLATQQVAKQEPAKIVEPAARQLRVRPVKSTVRKKAPRELEDFEKFQAEKELGAVRDLFLAKTSRKLITPKRGIDMCREIIRKYPDTEYAIGAQTLLRENVDPRFRERYNLTDEELGL
jgi:hypothetical protein